MEPGLMGIIIGIVIVLGIMGAAIIMTIRGLFEVRDVLRKLEQMIRDIKVQEALRQMHRYKGEKKEEDNGTVRTQHGSGEEGSI